MEFKSEHGKMLKKSAGSSRICRCSCTTMSEMNLRVTLVGPYLATLSDIANTIAMEKRVPWRIGWNQAVDDSGVRQFGPARSPEQLEAFSCCSAGLF